MIENFISNPWLWLLAFFIICLVISLIPKIMVRYYNLKYGAKYSRYFACKWADELLRKEVEKK